MRKLLFILLLISCSQEDQEMIQFITAISTSESEPVVDGGVNVFLTPDSSVSGDTGKGFTNTGNCLISVSGSIMTVANASQGGTNINNLPESIFPSVIIGELDYSASHNTAPYTEKFTKTDELIFPVSYGSLQGITTGNDGTLWVAATGDSKVVNIQPYSDGSGNAIIISEFNLSNVNGITFDDVNNELLIFQANGTNKIVRYSLAGALLDADVLDTPASTDMIYYNSSVNRFFINHNNNDIQVYRFSTKELLGDVTSFSRVRNGEGFFIHQFQEGDPWYIYFNSDAWYHQVAGDPDNMVNAMYKELWSFL